MAEDAAVGDQVGTALATDDDTGDTVSHSITSGNEAGAFRINENTGKITVATALNHETTASYVLTVQADDGRGGTDAATVNITVSDVAEDLAPAPEGLETSLADNTFTLTWNAVEGASKYEAQYRTSDTDDWIVLPETEGTTTTYTPEGGPACGTTYQFRVRSFGDNVAYADDCGLESGAETLETEACNQDPALSLESFSFTVDQTLLTGSAEGTTNAADPDEEDTVSHSITAGNEPPETRRRSSR